MKHIVKNTLRNIAVSLVLGSASFTVMATTAPIAQAAAPSSFANLAEKLLPAVVNISSTQKVEEMGELPNMPNFPEGSPFEDFFEQFMDRRGMGMPNIPQASLGSGFVIDAQNGIIVTNNHVIKDAEEVRVTFHDDETIVAEVIGRDEKTDLAILKVETDKKLTAVDFGDSDAMRVGDWVLAIGNPFGLGGTVTAGIISARQRDIQAGPYDDFLQTDASINRGNSGGPMFDLNGKVIGINTAIFSPTGGSVGIGFAIPSSLAKPVLDQIMKYGRTRRGWLGVRIQTVSDEIAESLGLEKARGALVAGVMPDGPADKAGLRVGDIILELNGKSIDEMRELPRLVAETNIDSKADIVFWRDGKSKKGKVVVGELEKAEDNGLIAGAQPTSKTGESEGGVELEDFGMTIVELNRTLRENFDIPSDVEGVIITSIKPGSEAYNKGLIEGDVIVEANQSRINTTADMIKVIEDVSKSKRSSILLLIQNDGDVRFIALKMK